MARPVVFRPEANAPRLVPLFVVVAKRIQASGAPRGVEPDGREQSPRRLDPRRCRTASLIGNHLNREPGFPQGALVRHREHLVRLRSVVRQDAQGLVVSPAPQPAHVSGKRLALGLVVVQHPDFPSNELRHPDRAGVSLGPGAADVPERPVGHERIGRHMAHAALRAGFGEARGVVGPIRYRGVVTVPDVGVLVGRVHQVKPALGVEFVREPVVVVPVGVDHHRVRRKLWPSQQLVHRVGLQLRVPREPQFGARLADRRA